MNPTKKPRKGRRCWHRLRYRIARRGRKADPATSVFLQLMAIMLLVFGRVPLLPSRHPTARPDGQPEPVRRDDWTRDQQEREGGEGGQQIILSQSFQRSPYRVQPSYRRLVRDLRRPHEAARTKAADVLRLRVPPEALAWLKDILENEDWAALAWCTRPGMSKDETEKAMLRSALDWTASRHDPDSSRPGGSTSRPDKP